MPDDTSLDAKGEAVGPATPDTVGKFYILQIRQNNSPKNLRVAGWRANCLAVCTERPVSLLIRTLKEKSVVTFHPRLVAVLALFAAISLPRIPAHAGLLGIGKTVQATYYNGSFANAELQIPVGQLTGDPVSLATAVDYQSGVADLATIHVGDTQIVITNQSAAVPFCNAVLAGTACTDPFSGFGFKFTGESLLGVSVDPASAPSFLPVVGTFQGNTHAGLQLLSSNEILLDLTGDVAAFNDQLILDLSFAPVTNPPSLDAPEPATLVLLGFALVAFGASRRWRGTNA